MKGSKMQEETTLGDACTFRSQDEILPTACNTAQNDQVHDQELWTWDVRGSTGLLVRRIMLGHQIN